MYLNPEFVMPLLALGSVGLVLAAVGVAILLYRINLLSQCTMPLQVKMIDVCCHSRRPRGTVRYETATASGERRLLLPESLAQGTGPDRYCHLDDITVEVLCNPSRPWQMIFPGDRLRNEQFMGSILVVVGSVFTLFAIVFGLMFI